MIEISVCMTIADVAKYLDRSQLAELVNELAEQFGDRLGDYFADELTDNARAIIGAMSTAARERE